MYRKSLIAAVALIGMTSFASAADVTLCAGKPGLKYDSIMQSIGQELTRQGHNVSIINLGGSEDILNALNAGRCAYGPAQKDVHYLLTKQNAALASTTTPIALLYNEVMQMFCTKDSGIDELEDITADTKIITDAIGSGSALSWSTMVNIEKEYGGSDEWSQAKTEFTPLDEAVAALSLGNADCAFGVGGMPISWGTALDQNGFTVVYLSDKDLNDLLVGKAPLYSPKRIPRGSNAYSSKFDTYLIPAVLFRSNKTPTDPQIDNIVKRLAPSLGSKYNTVQ